jgi:AcrR family transcriptional regulator
MDTNFYLATGKMICYNLTSGKMRWEVFILRDHPYHRENLRNQLIEVGIKLINDIGPKEFSMRKVAVKCQVSHTAPYTYFKDKDALIEAMGEHVTGLLMEQLHGAVRDKSDDCPKIPLLGHAYINFFMENPEYYQFLFYYANVSIDLDRENEKNFPPFAIFREAVFNMFRSIGVPREEYTKNLIALWAMAHGVVSLMTNRNISYSGDWREVYTNTIFSGGKAP